MIKLEEKLETVIAIVMVFGHITVWCAKMRSINTFVTI